MGLRLTNRECCDIYCYNIYISLLIIIGLQIPLIYLQNSEVYILFSIFSIFPMLIIIMVNLFLLIEKYDVISFKKYVYNKSYKINLKTGEIFDFNNELLTLKVFETLSDNFRENSVKNIYERILNNDVKKIVNPEFQKIVLIDKENHNIHYLLDENTFNDNLSLQEIYVNKQDCSIAYVYLLKNQNKICYKIEKYSSNLFFKNINKIKEKLNFKIKEIDENVQIIKKINCI